MWLRMAHTSSGHRGLGRAAHQGHNGAHDGALAVVVVVVAQRPADEMAMIRSGDCHVAALGRTDRCNSSADPHADNARLVASEKHAPSRDVKQATPDGGTHEESPLADPARVLETGGTAAHTLHRRQHTLPTQPPRAGREPPHLGHATAHVGQQQQSARG